MAEVLVAAFSMAGVSLATGVTAQAAETCQMIKSDTLPVEMDGNQPLVKVAVNGHPVYFLVDTGAALSMILRGKAEELDLPGFSGRNGTLSGVGGRSDIQTTRIKTFTLGKQTVTDMPLSLAGERSLGREDVVGLLGEDVFRKFDVEFDLAHGVINLYQPRGCDSAFLGFWAENAMTADIHPVNPQNPKIAMDVTVAGQPVRAILDSGATHSVLSSQAAARAGVTPDTPGVVMANATQGVGAKTVQEWVGVFDGFALGDETIKHAKLRFGDLFGSGTYTDSGSRIAQAQTGPEMLLGADFLRAHHVLIAHSQNKLYFTYNGGPVFQVTGPALRRTRGKNADAN
ncbi:retroviral-like aspartic protease family protein [Nitrospirillum sp. BR 11828]|uniref:retroviral-like aspartic protease family protein n=1 Tax=Nitrospirillum sp. BR 11828 TaxID=3104325 RepID=UPI002ACA2810|nr:retroviral-like aspartic protease family protein [Nitrospirillum sp. BR 11828]MDZ5646530.1 retroviral-like aspartic protease family protein [Nitrospirillum sp. BR 11828]